MAYLERSRATSLPGLAAVATLHVALIYALMCGMRTNIVEILAPPVKMRVVDNVMPPPPPPPPPAPTLVQPRAIPLAPPDIILAAPPEHAPLTTRVAPLPAPTPPTSSPQRQEHDFTPAQILSGSPSPDYPEAYADDPRSGQVIVDCVIEITGVPTQCRAVHSSGGPAFAAETLRWLTGPSHPTYRPAVRDGAPRREEHQWKVMFEPPQ